MKKSIFICVCMLLSSFLFYSCTPDDAVIQGEIKSKMVLSYPSVTCSVRNAIVSLGGTVDSEEAKANAEEIARGAKDVKSVVNEINVVVPPPVVSPDEVLRTAVTVALDAAGLKNVGVDVKNEEVTLSGNVPKADQKKVLDVVKGIKTKKVINEMK
ncbi:MAG: BON domain-containing protein [Dysgonomonas sp.]